LAPCLICKGSVKISSDKESFPNFYGRSPALEQLPR
jgi:hypothetical protein